MIKLKHIPLYWFLCWALSVSFASAHDLFSHPAAYDPAAPYCVSSTRHAPDGQIVRVASRYFRVCHDPPNPEISTPRQLTTYLNSSAIKGLQFHATTLALRVISGWDWDKRVERRTTINRQEIDQRMFGGISYRTFEYTGGAPGVTPSGYFYLYDPALNTNKGDFPRHQITCYREFTRESPSEAYQCFLLIEYRSDIAANLMFIGVSDNSHPPPNQIGWHTIRPELFPRYVHDVITALEFADVTDELDAFRGRLPIIE